MTIVLIMKVVFRKIRNSQLIFNNNHENNTSTTDGNMFMKKGTVVACIRISQLYQHMLTVNNGKLSFIYLVYI